MLFRSEYFQRFVGRIAINDHKEIRELCLRFRKLCLYLLYELTAQYYLADLRRISDLRGIIVSSLLLMITIVGIPFGFQTLKLSMLALCPFGREIRSCPGDGGCLSVLMNIIWILVGGIWISLSHLAFGVLLCITVIGIPFGLQHFKLAGLALTPFGKEIV